MTAFSEPRPELAGLRLADPPEAWGRLGFSVQGSRLRLGGVELELGVPGRGIVGWTLRGVPAVSSIDGLATEAAEAAEAAEATEAAEAAEATGDPRAPSAVVHRNGAVGVDHVVVVTPDFDRTVAALREHGMAPRRIRHVGEGPEQFRQAFRRLGPAILEVVESARVPPGPARFWGLTLIVSDLDAFVAELGPERISAAREAVQPGRRIATLRRAAGLGQPVAVMDPDPARPSP